tara:strand:- start:24467 stop:24916 length:450 start_codon:yes stop_codon:yes gene_type:complete
MIKKLVLMLLLVLSSSTASPGLFFQNPFTSLFEAKPVFTTIFDTIQLQSTLQDSEPILLETSIEPRNEIIIEDLTFSPKVITIASGDEITWINQRQGLKALVMGLREISQMRSPFMEPNDEFSFTFNVPGTYTYSDGVIIGVIGKIIVE